MLRIFNLYIHSFAILLNSFSMTAIMLICGMAGAPALTADIAIVQGSTLALFYAFSGNARNIIFADGTGSVPHVLLRVRLMLILPLAIAAFVLSSVVGTVDGVLTIVLIMRRASEWIGEVFLSSFEVRSRKKPPIITVIAEIISFILSLVLIFGANVRPAAAMLLWAAAPLAAALSGRLPGSPVPVSIRNSLAILAPNLGSTTIIGVVVYIFRLSITLLVGRVQAGNLFTAFAIGGLFPTIYNSSIGPSLALRAPNISQSSILYRYMKFLNIALFFAGLILAALFQTHPAMVFLNKSHYFWISVGLSLSGGAIMLVAMHLRIVMLQKNRNIEIFGADVLSNILIVVSVPYFFYLLGYHSLEYLYLFNACLTLAFYWSAKTVKEGLESEKVKLFFISAMILVPVFFQLSGTIFRDSSFIFDSGRLLKQVPIPLSAIIVAIGILWIGRFRETHLSVSIFFFTAIFLVMASLVVNEPQTQAERLILMAQYLLPVLGLILGEMFGWATRHDEFEKTAIFVILAIVPFQLICSWVQGFFVLTPYLYAFSIYQHFHYVPLIMTLSYGMALYRLWNNGRKWRIVLVGMLPFLAVYAEASFSIEISIVLFCIIVGALWMGDNTFSSRSITLLFLGCALLTGAFYSVATKTDVLYHFFGKGQKTEAIRKTFVEMKNRSRAMEALAARSSAPGDTGQLLKQWKFYSHGAVQTINGFLFGHPDPPDRKEHPSAYNYYLDLIYNFGFLALVPLIYLLIRTGKFIFDRRKTLKKEPALIAASLAVIFVFLIDNFMNVGLRQPYPGIFGFFILGFLQARISRSQKSAQLT
ncbi:MAG: hypothetical protein ACYDHW_00135 [Syntrophorhabdaceae bacterium]